MISYFYSNFTTTLCLIANFTEVCKDNQLLRSGCHFCSHLPNRNKTYCQCGSGKPYPIFFFLNKKQLGITTQCSAPSAPHCHRAYMAGMLCDGIV